MAGRAPAFRCVFQSFAELGGPAHGAARVAALRAELAARGLNGFVAPRADEHQNEYVPAAAERLLWLTGFSGSAGMAIVLKDAAAIFVDGRYTVQAPAQVDTATFGVRHLVDQPPSAWIEANLQRGERLGYDPWLHTPEMVERLGKACRAAGGELVAVEFEPDRRDLARPARGAARRDWRAQRASQRRKRGEEDRACARRSRGERWPPRKRRPRGRLAVQHPRRRRCAYAATAELRLCAARGSPDSVRRRPQAVERDALAARRIGRDRRARSSRPVHDGPRRARRARGVRRFERAGAADPGAGGGGRRGGSRPRSDRADEGGEEQGRARRRTRCAHPRRRRDGALSLLVRSRGAQGQAHRDRCDGGVGDVSARDGSAQGRLVSHHRRRGAARGDSALSRQRGFEPQDRPRDLSRRQRRPIRRRHDRHHSHDGRRPPERGDARPLHPRAARAISRSRGQRSPKGRAARRSTPSRARACGAPASISTTARATASARISPSTKARSASPRRARSRWRRA